MEQPIKLEVGVKAFIQNADGKYLILKRTKPYVGNKSPKWDIPGGRIKPGEETLDALAREIKEETGLTFQKVIRILAAQDIMRVAGKHTVRITYLVSCKGTTVTLLPEEHTAYKWATLHELKKSYHDNFLTPVIKILER